MVSAIVLAAGESSRMGQPKPLLKAGDKTFLETITDRLEQAGVREIVVVLGHRRAEVMAGWNRRNERIVFNPRPEAGQVTSLQVALPHLSVPYVEAAMVCLVDTPLVLASTYEALLRRWKRRGGGIYLPTYKGKHGHPVLFDHRWFHELKICPADVGMRWVISRHSDEKVEVEVDDPGVVQDIDTPDDYKKYVR